MNRMLPLLVLLYGNLAVFLNSLPRLRSELIAFLALIALIAIKAIDVTADGHVGYGAKPHISCPAIVIFKSLICQ